LCFAAGRFVRGFLYSEVPFGTTKAGGNRIMQTISIQTDWESVGTALTWSLCGGDCPTQVTAKRGSTV